MHRLAWILAAAVSALVPRALAEPDVERPPADYVLVPGGDYVHPSCIVDVANDDLVNDDGSVLDSRTGATRTVPACGHSHFKKGHAGSQKGLGMASISPPVADGWWYYAQNIYPGFPPFTPVEDLQGYFIVPRTAPSQIGTFYTFPGLVTTNGGGLDIILQPVLGYNQAHGPAGWSVAGWNCCHNGNYYVSPFVAVSPGQIIRGYINAGSPIYCNYSTGICQFYVIGADVFNGATKVNNTQFLSSPFGFAFDVIFGGAVEIYGATTCSQLPLPPMRFYSLTAHLFNGTPSGAPVTFNLASETPAIAGCPGSVTIVNGTTGSVTIDWQCTGCRTSNGDCRLGTEEDACGPVGGSCSDCSLSGRACVNRRCYCNPKTGC